MFHYDSIKKPLLGNWNWYGWTVFHFHHNQDGATTAPTIILPLYVFVFVSVFWTKFSSVLYLYCAPLECALWLLLLLHLVTFCPWALPACNFQGGAKGGGWPLTGGKHLCHALLWMWLPDYALREWELFELTALSSFVGISLPTLQHAVNTWESQSIPSQYNKCQRRTPPVRNPARKIPIFKSCHPVPRQLSDFPWNKNGL